MKDELSELLVKLKNLESQDRDVDKEIASVFGSVSKNGVPLCAGYVGIGMFTAHFDAAVNLAKAALPDMNYYGVEHEPKTVEAFVQRNFCPKEEALASFAEHPTSDAIAMVIAVVKAKLEGR
jgi:hypothetical protein